MDIVFILELQTVNWFSSKMYSSGSTLDNSRDNGPLAIDLIHDRQTEHYFRNVHEESSNEQTFDETTCDEDDYFTFDSKFAPMGWVFNWKYEEKTIKILIFEHHTKSPIVSGCRLSANTTIYRWIMPQFPTKMRLLVIHDD